MKEKCIQFITADDFIWVSRIEVDGGWLYVTRSRMGGNITTSFVPYEIINQIQTPEVWNL